MSKQGSLDAFLKQDKLKPNKKEMEDMDVQVNKREAEKIIDSSEKE